MVAIKTVADYVIDFVEALRGDLENTFDHNIKSNGDKTGAIKEAKELTLYALDVNAAAVYAVNAIVNCPECNGENTRPDIQKNRRDIVVKYEGNEAGIWVRFECRSCKEKFFVKVKDL